MSEPEKTFNLTATMPEINSIFAVLVKLPWETANPLIQKFDKQIRDQMPAPAEKPARPTAKAAPAAEVETDEEIEDVGEVAAAPPVSHRRVQDQPDPLPRRPVRTNGRAAPDLAAGDDV